MGTNYILGGACALVLVGIFLGIARWNSKSGVGKKLFEEGGDTVYTVTKVGAEELSDDDVVYFHSRIFSKDGELLLDGGPGWQIVRKNVPALRTLLRKIGVGGEGELLAPYDEYIPGGAESVLPFGQPVLVKAKVIDRIPSRFAVDFDGREAVFLVIDSGGRGDVHTLAGKDWRNRDDTSKWIDTRDTVLFSGDGGERVFWEWIGPDSGLLVVNAPSNEDITGLDLVGRAVGGGGGTSYDAVGRFDTDGDGKIKGSELAVLSFWKDANGDGLANNGEVRPASEVFTWIGAQAEKNEEGILSSPMAGAQLATGSEVGSWEWRTRGAGATGNGTPLSGLDSGGGEAAEVRGRGARMLVFNVCGGDRVDELTAAGGGGVSSRSIALLGEDGKRAGRWDWVGPCSGVFVLPDIIDAGENEVSEYIYGSNTGGQNWSDSYAALDLLDSDRSGWLEGDELKKVAVWVDRSSDARVDPWEIKPASDTISKINVAPQLSSEGDLGVRDSGVVFQTGGGSSTWCWESKPRP